MPNRLINEKSPYLQQHSHNPVDWYAWNSEAFIEAEHKNLPIFLSIGYSTCYWCHVMERECFENPEIANLMNKHFINIKVDREERPDIDKIYMNALQSMTGAGGWPISIFLTPDLKPFYAATYIPPKSKYGRAGFEDVLEEISNLWTNKRGEIISSSKKVYDILKSNLEINKIPEDNILSESISSQLYSQAESFFDDENGGFGKGNKFPRPVLLNFLLVHNYIYDELHSLDMVTFTLDKMLRGGIHDHLEGGFHRYSVDSYWRVPHFEKMLYDQSQIAVTYLNAYQLTKRKIFLTTAIDTLNYSLTILKSPKGGFYSAEDSESAIDAAKPDIKEEGYYYLFTLDELRNILTEEELKAAKYYFGLEENGNTLGDSNNVFGNKNVLYIKNDEFETAKFLSISSEEVIKLINSAKDKMLRYKRLRPRPTIDDKILTNLNAQMISTLSKAYEVTLEKKYLDIAIETADFILEKMYDSKNRILFHRYIDDEVKYNGTLADYSYLIASLVDLYEASFISKYIFIALELIDIAIEKFYDETYGGFFDSDKDSKDVIIRIKDIYDGSEPSGNSTMIINLIRLGYYVEEKFYNEIAMKTLEVFYQDIEQNPFAYPNYVFGLLEYLKSPFEIITKGEKNEKFAELINTIRQTYLPFRILMYADEDFINRFKFIKNIIDTSSEPEIFVCENYKCNLPVKTKEDLISILNNKFIK